MQSGVESANAKRWWLGRLNRYTNGEQTKPKIARCLWIMLYTHKMERSSCVNLLLFTICS